MRKIRRRFVRISAGMIGLRWNQLTRQSWFRRIVICLLAYIPCTHSFSCKAANRDNNTLLANSVICAFLTDYNSANIYRQLTNDSPLFLLLHSLPTMRSKTCLWLFLPPATKLGQGYIFTGICHSVNKEGASSRGVGGCFLLGGVCFLPGGSGGDPPGRLLLRAVRILLECILLLKINISV